MYTIYGTENCSYCVIAKAYLESERLEYKYIDVMEDQDALALFMEWGFKSVPQIFHDDILVGGSRQLVDYLKEQASNG